jgi:3-methyl-2-oxobutanoate hydroxymethyltransferase
MNRARLRDSVFRCSIVNKITPDMIRSWKGTRRRISALTAYDYPTARLLDEAGIDLLLVGD